MNKSIVVALVLPLILGCAAKREVRIAPLYADDPYWTHVIPKADSAVLVTEGDLHQKYTPIARLFVESTGRDKGRSFARLREEAAKIGADAVIQIKVSSQYEGQNVNTVTGQPMGPRNRHTLEGLAVIFDR